MGELPITSKQAQQLEVASNKQLSPYLEICCLRMSANVSYEDAAADIQKHPLSIHSFINSRTGNRELGEIGKDPKLDDRIHHDRNCGNECMDDHFAFG